MVKKSSWKTSSIAICQDCGWRNEEMSNAQATAAIHAKKHCHLVLVETAIASHYDGRV
jgi:hypothetical protein